MVRKLDPDHVMWDVGRRVGELRAGHGLTQEEFAVRLEITLTNVQRAELGRNLTIRTLVRLANHLGVGVGALFEAPKTRRPKRGRPRKRAPSA